MEMIENSNKNRRVPTSIVFFHYRKKTLSNGNGKGYIQCTYMYIQVLSGKNKNHGDTITRGYNRIMG